MALGIIAIFAGKVPWSDRTHAGEPVVPPGIGALLAHGSLSVALV